MNRHSFYRCVCLSSALLALLLLPRAADAHAVPDIPVRGTFQSDGLLVLQVEVDPRCFAEDAEAAPYLNKSDLAKLSKKQQQAYFDQAGELIKKTLEFHFEPADAARPEFTYRFEERPDADPDEAAGIPVTIVAEWKARLAGGLQGYRLEALKAGRFSVYFLNTIDGKEQKLNVLFPGETSYRLDLSGVGAPAADSAAPAGSDADAPADDDGSEQTGASMPLGRGNTFAEFLRLGFIHVLPRGLDHILFVLGLFLMSRKLRPLVLQVTTFTVAHSISLALSTLGLVRVSPDIVEPVIALSIAFVALENIFRREYTHWRLLVVFVFGLVHGLGFAGVLSELLGRSHLVPGLLGFNVGVELGQLTVILAAAAVTYGLSEKAHRRYVVVPGSVLIALMGLYWTIDRI